MKLAPILVLLVSLPGSGGEVADVSEAGRASEALAGEAASEAAPGKSEEPIEEVLVGARRLEPDRVRPLSEIYQVYSAHQRGGDLYRRHRYEEALPYLLRAAQQGFKLSQFRLAYLYRFGLGGLEHDAEGSDRLARDRGPRQRGFRDPQHLEPHHGAATVTTSRFQLQ